MKGIFSMFKSTIDYDELDKLRKENDRKLNIQHHLAMEALELLKDAIPNGGYIDIKKIERFYKKWSEVIL